MTDFIIYLSNLITFNVFKSMKKVTLIRPLPHLYVSRFLSLITFNVIGKEVKYTLAGV